jgi:zinc D-Ala-D-Ala carboxypeptidase
VAVGYQPLASSSSTARAPSTASSSSRAAPPIHALRSQHRGAPGQADGVVPGSAAVSRHRGALGEADGAVPDGTTVFDDEVPGVAKLDSALLDALRQAASAAADDGVEFVVDSGWRSPAYQEQLLQEAVLKYGSEAEASRWVATPNTSAHVSGDAVDVGPSGAAAWLSAHGAAYGLCRVYANEPWHYELRPEAIDHGCPAMYADPTHDPRMQR